jgi:hypothetical protein
VALFAVVVAMGPGAAPRPIPVLRLRSFRPAWPRKYRQFDFWVGDWDVLDPAGNVVGTNKITR